MPKYHINANGDVKPCKATQRACRYGDDRTHYDTPEAAHKAYEAQQQNTINTVKKTAINNNPGKIQKTADQLVSDLSSANGKMIVTGEKTDKIGLAEVIIQDLDWSTAYYKERDQKLPNSKFRKIGAGTEQDVYYDGEKYVYKVRNLVRTSVVNDRLQLENNRVVLDENIAKQHLKSHRELQESYATINLSRVHRAGFSVAEMYFVTTKDRAGNEIPVIVQEHLDLEVWHPYEPTDREIETLSRIEGLYDFTEGNIVRNAKTGEKKLIDCFGIYEDFSEPDDYYDEERY